MYLDYFKLKKSPFHITPDPEFLFLSQSHKEASASIYYGIETKKGFIAVTGEVGVGKTTILRSYLEGTDPDKIRIVYIFNAALSFDRLLDQICSEFGIRTAGKDSAELVDLLFNYLIEEYKKDRNVVLIVDEAQNMPVETLERLRMLSNLETSQDKLLQIILVGQPEFEAKLDLPELRQLKQRMAIRSRIEPLTSEESFAYINHRLMKASLFHNPIFTKKALTRIIKESKGIPRTINILCDNALVTGAGYRCKPVDEKIAEEVIRDFRGPRPPRGLRWKIIWAPVLSGFMVAAFLVFRTIVPDPAKPSPEKRKIVEKLHEPLPAHVHKDRVKIVRAVQSLAVKIKEPAVAKVHRDKMGGTDPGEGAGENVAKPAAQEVAEKSNGAPSPEAGKAAPAPEMSKSAPSPEVKRAGNGFPSARSEPSAPIAPRSGGDRAPSAKPPGIDPAPAKPDVLPVKKASGGPSSQLVVVRSGDSVSKLLMGIYGIVSPAMLASFKQLNPQVKDINKISVGAKILLP
ncbi:MAG: AAA family ATPase [Syntrophobacteraceae bacterium]|nr:AAA family ATPase [Syntrophobacteraceae bacterium]